VLIVEKEASMDDRFWWRFSSTGPFNTGGVPNIVSFGIHKVIQDRKRHYFDGAVRDTRPRFMKF
jgi:hypothetical protein